MAEGKERVRVDGRELVLTNLDKVMYPETGTTKADVLAYYAAVAPVLIPAAADRPATRKRWVHGVGTAEAPGEMFFQKNLDHSTPGWVPRASITHKDRTVQYPLVNDPATLTWLAQIAALEIHVPQWRVDSGGDPLPPDRLVLDLDPGEGAGLAECVEVATLARAILRDVGLDPVPVTSGSKGIHLYAALDGTQSSDQIADFAHELARALEADHPDLAVSDMKKTLRTGKVLVDWSQNNAAKTTIVPYSLRGRLRPTVAAPAPGGSSRPRPCTSWTTAR
ncbi:non-homologous end-joining DNA ligase [Pseudarthrobacter sp. L19]|uniref:non-homologous end-joining DNA ligase n=1 Tax=Pseudarthrobacter sp. L19 TaxID=3423951 RepID=UPI003D797D75